MDTHNSREEQRLDIVDKVGEVGHILVTQVLVEERARQKVAATEAADIGEQTQAEDDNLEALGCAVLGERDVGATQSLQTLLVQTDQATAGLVEVLHRRVDGDHIAGAPGTQDEVVETEVLEGGSIGFTGGDTTERLQVQLERVAVVGIHVFDDKVLSRHFCELPRCTE